MLILPIKKEWFDMILSSEKKKNIGKLSPTMRSGSQIALWEKTNCL